MARAANARERSLKRAGSVQQPRRARRHDKRHRRGDEHQSRKSLYYHFKSKKKIVEALFRGLPRGYRGDAGARRRSVPQTPRTSGCSCISFSNRSGDIASSIAT